ncbi:hypothetical protein L1049_003779 [Liquidambar formosana]|uniref:Uncharacterized protein n=1 Tax=Liquidambar formosana TaxID=63359 RepID=A0AAP0RNH5_LIQFO
MGAASPQALLVLKGMVLANKERCKSNLPLWSKALEAQAKRRWRGGRKQGVTGGLNGGHVRCKRPTGMKWRARLARSRRPANGVERRVRTLKKLIPNTESTGLDGLFRETADYILALQMRVRVMQSMVKALSGSDE